jgi:hypothetical protein
LVISRNKVTVGEPVVERNEKEELAKEKGKREEEKRRRKEKKKREEEKKRVSSRGV